MNNSFDTKDRLEVGGRSWQIFSLARLDHAVVSRLPFSLRVLLENLLRHEDGRTVTREQIDGILNWDPKAAPEQEIAYHPARVLLQDFTGVPAVCDLAGMRDAMAEMGGDPDRINPLQPADLVIDHSVQIDRFASAGAFGANVTQEMERNIERYGFLRWGGESFQNFSVVPPGKGICHQVNLEYLARVVFDGGEVAYPDTLVGTDSHTTMINGLGVVGWGVGGIEAEAAMLGQPISMLVPQVVGFRLSGSLAQGATATDLVLTVTQKLRRHGVVGKFVEFFGPGLSALSLPDRATLANMAPEYGATVGFFPVDEETVAYLRFTGRDEASVALVEAYCRQQGLYRTPESPDPEFSDVLELDLGDVKASMAGPLQPEDRVELPDLRKKYRGALVEMTGAEKNDDVTAWIDSASSDTPAALAQTSEIRKGRLSYKIGHGTVVIASITSCTNTSNPAVMIAAGLLAKNAVERGLSTAPWVKTSLAPGSRVVTEYLEDAGLMPYLQALGFHLVGYGCTTCIGNSGPLPEEVTQAIGDGDLVAASVLSGNRNFAGRISPLSKMNFLASPPLVVAFALAGQLDVDLTSEALGHDRGGQPVYLSDIWPSPEQIRETMRAAVRPEQFSTAYGEIFNGDESWRALEVPEGKTFAWREDSTYIKRPPFFDDVPKDPQPTRDIAGARILGLLGDSVTTDHISPAGAIPVDSPAGRYLIEHGVEPAQFNSFGSRRGNHEVMMRGTFGNIRLRNQMVPGVEGGFTRHEPSGEQMTIYDAAMRYREESAPLVILAGSAYGTGSSRDWAAKGTLLLGVRAVIVTSFERIHRSNLIGMGVLPLEFIDGESAASHALDGSETIDIRGIAGDLSPGKIVSVTATRTDGSSIEFSAKARLDTPNEVDYYRHGGILLYVLRQLLAS